MASLKSNLDANAQEFISSVDIAKRKCLQELTLMLEPIFDGGSDTFNAQLKKARQVSVVESVNAARILGEVVTDLATKSPSRATTGFRFFQRLREDMPDYRAQEAVMGVVNTLHKATKDLTSGPRLSRLMNNQVSSCNNHDHGSHCEEAGDIPTQSTRFISTENVFGILTFLNLVITRLNLSDTSVHCACIPPILSSVDLCLLVERTCSLVSSTSEKITTSTIAALEHQLDISLMVTEKNWTGWLYQLLDIFLQSIVHFNYLLSSMNIRLPLENWYRWTQDLDLSSLNALSHSDPYDSQTEGQLASYFPELLARTLTWMRKLLIDGSFHQHTIRNIVTDSLMTMGELVAVTNATWNAPANPMNFELNSELSDEAEESFARFMEESNQLS